MATDFQNPAAPRTLPAIDWHPPREGCLAAMESAEGQINLKYGTIASGRGAGIEVVQIDTGPMQVTLLPTRGMAIWQVICDGIPFKWNSPVDGPVHPSLVPVHDPGGIGWLEGFDELLVRCGLVSNGAPEFEESGRLRYPLHGRIANTPAERVWSEEVEGRCVVAGETHEKRLFFNNLTLTTRVSVAPGGREIEIEDTVSNHGSQPAETQMLYHINVGAPVLEEGAKLLLAYEELSPRNDHAASDIPTWDRYPGPKSGYQEQVHLFRVKSDAAGSTAMMLQSPGGQQGFGLSYDTSTLPYFIVWKNTAAHEDGYVTGLEPATNFPNPRSFEGERGRVATVPAGGSITHRVNLHPLVGQQNVDSFAEKVHALQGNDKPTVHQQPNPDWAS
ncbi:aldose 1-epimerase family protein [Rosistilla oblonga]|uniref:aldose 1-epimerase family protein n=1 Tax=Rosistilla oblonga TaxID=2527990 RepID=UPI003A979B9C